MGSRQRELDRFIAGIFDAGAQSESSMAELSAVLKADADARQRYLEHVEMHALLAHEQGLLAAYQGDAQDDTSSARRRPDPLIASPSFRAAAAAFVAAGIFLAATIALDHGGPLTAEDVRPTGSGGSFLPGDLNTQTVSFKRDIEPVLSDRCFQCHGPDEENRKGDVRLDDGELFFENREGGAPPLVVRFRPEESPLFARISSHDPEEVMPPSASHPSLANDEIELFERWILEGAEW